MSRITAALFLVATLGCAAWILARPSEALAESTRPPRERRAAFALGALLGATQLFANLPANPLGAVLGAAQGVLICSVAFAARGQRAGMLVAVLMAVVALLLHLLGAPAFRGTA